MTTAEDYLQSAITCAEQARSSLLALNPTPQENGPNAYAAACPNPADAREVSVAVGRLWDALGEMIAAKKLVEECKSQLRSQSQQVTPSLLVIRECARKL